MGPKFFATSNVIRNAAELNRTPLMTSEGFVSYAALPLIAKGQVKGVLEVFGRTPFRSDTDWLDFFSTLAGQTAIGRGGMSILRNLGMPELIAETADRYLEIANQLAANLSQLRAMRTELRPKMQASPLMDAERFTRGMELAYRQMWRRWCGLKT